MSGLMFQLDDDTVHSSSMSRIAGDSGAPPTRSPPSDSPFNFSAEQWRGISQMVQQIDDLNHGVVPDLPHWQQSLAAVTTGRTRIPLFVEAYQAFARQVAGFHSTIFPSIVGLARGVVQYGRQTVPSLYGRLQTILAPLETRAPTPQDSKDFEAALALCLSQANQMREQAASVARPLAAFATAAAQFNAATAQTPASLKVQILPDIGGGVALGVSEDHTLAVGRTTNKADPLQLWDVMYDRNTNASRLFISLPGANRVLGQRGPVVQLPMIGMIFAAPQLQICAAVENNALVTDGVLWSLDVDVPVQKIVLVKAPGFCMDIAGNSGWGHGTPVLSFRINDGNNQHWILEPKPYYPTDTIFLEFVLPAANLNSPAVVQTLQALEGAWDAICADLEDVADKIGRRINLGQPFVSGLTVDAVIRNWSNVAHEAEELIANGSR